MGARPRGMRQLGAADELRQATPARGMLLAGTDFSAHNSAILLSDAVALKAFPHSQRRDIPENIRDCTGFSDMEALI